MWAAPNYWIAEGHELQSIIGMLYDFDPERIDFQDQELATERYDVAMVPPGDMGEKALTEAIRTALQRELGLLLIQDVRRRDVYIVTALDGAQVGTQETEDTGTTIHIGGGGIAMRSGTIGQFCSALERELDRPVIDESRLQGHYSIEVNRGMKTKGQFFEQLQNELGLLVSSGERDVTMLVVRRR
jgi:uncharacterized protein (TIGR03435 family)